MVEVKYEMKIIKKEDSNFPWRLRVLDDCPDILYVLGNTNILNDFSIAVVGSRICDEYGKSVTETLTKELVMRDVCIVSGLALGIDTYAHKTALKFNGKTIAVIGNGFADIYPSENKELVKEIIENGGAIISEYLPDQEPKNICFPHRNRIVACMTEGTIVTQARNKSGALITAHIAQKHDKKVFAVPGQINDEKNIGSNSLFSSGAKIVLDIKDIMTEFPNYKYMVKNIPIIETNKKEPPEKYKEIYELLSDKPKHITEICKHAQKSAQEVMSDLTLLELTGFIQMLPGGLYKIK